MKAIILCAGYATRLYPLTQNQPKALLAVGDKTILSHTIEKIEKLPEIDEIFIVTNDRFINNFWHWREAYTPKKPTHLISDGTKTNEDRLGAIGDMKFVLDTKNVIGDALVILGDNLFEFSLEKFMARYKEKGASMVALYDIKAKQEASKKYGVVVLDDTDRITDFEEKPEHPKTSLVSTGIYIFSGTGVEHIHHYAKTSSKRDNPGDFVRSLSQHESVYGYVFKENWFDIGSFEALEEAYAAHGRPGKHPR